MNRNAARRGAVPNQLRRSQAGFSLIELLIVVAIILIVAAIAIPNLMRARMAANEAGAAEALRTITTGETTYSAACPDIGYSATLMELHTGVLCAGGKNCIDDVLGASDPSTKNGYQFTYLPIAVAGLNSSFTATSVPVAPGASGQRAFFTDQTGIIRYTLNGAIPTPTSSALQ
ncbi:MAG: prepilin-type N-terminal cleavage/methylation domain-containing protein [Candidatus Acidiferrum sp.]